MAWRKLPWKACKGGLGLCLGAVNLSLGVLAVLLAGIILSIHLVGTVALPRFAVDLLQERFAREGLVVTWQSARFDLTGRWEVEGLECRERASGHPILSADFVRVDLDLTGALGRAPLSLEYLHLRDADLYLPPELALDAGEEAALHLAEGWAHWRRERVEVEHLELAVDDAVLHFRGPIPLPIAVEAAAEPPEAGLAHRWRDEARQLQPLLSLLRTLPALSGHATTSLSPGGPWLAEVLLVVPEARTGPVRLREMAISIPEIDLLGRAFHRPARASIGELWRETDSAPAVEDLECFQRGGPGPLPAGWRGPATGWIYGRLAGDLFPGLSVSTVLDLGFRPTGTEGELRLAAPGGSLRARFQVLPERARERAQVAFTWQGDPGPLLELPPLEALGLAEQVSFTSFTFLEGVLHFTDGPIPEIARMRVRALGSRVREAHFDEAMSSAWFTPKALQVGPIRAFDAGGQRAEGYYLQDFTTGDFRIVAQGRVRPRRLDSLLPSFYRDLWERIDPGVAPANADVDVISRWGDPALTHALVQVDANDLGYAGIPVDRVHLLLWQATGFVDLMDLRVRSPRGALEGSIALTFPPADAPDTPRLRHLHLEAQLGLGDMVTIFGEELEPARTHFTFSSPLQLGIDGTVSVYADQSNHKDIAVSLATDAPWTFRGVPFDSLQGELTLDGNEVRFDPLRLGADSGHWELRGHLDRPPSSGPTFALDTLAEGFPLTTLTALGRSFAASPDPGAPPAKLPGEVDFELVLRGTDLAWEQLQGGGQVSIEEASLGEIHLLGGLSRVLSSAGLNLTTFRLDQARSALALQEGILRFPDLVVRGPSLRLDTPGSLQLADQALDFRTKVFLLSTEDPTLRGLLGPLLRPLGHVFEVEVGGTIADPHWHLVNNPLNLLRPREPRSAPGEQALPASGPPPTPAPEAPPAPEG